MFYEKPYKNRFRRFSRSIHGLHPCYCYLVDVNDDEQAELGADPELRSDEQVLKDMRWFSLTEKKDDMQVSKVIDVLNIKVKN